MEYPLDAPQTLVSTFELTKFKIENLRIVPFVNASMVIQLLTEENQIAKSQFLIMHGEDYTNWQGDDQYLINWVKSKITL